MLARKTSARRVVAMLMATAPVMAAAPGRAIVLTLDGTRRPPERRVSGCASAARVLQIGHVSQRVTIRPTNPGIGSDAASASTVATSEAESGRHGLIVNSPFVRRQVPQTSPSTSNAPGQTRGVQSSRRSVASATRSERSMPWSRNQVSPLGRRRADAAGAGAARKLGSSKARIHPSPVGLRAGSVSPASSSKVDFARSGVIRPSRQIRPACPVRTRSDSAAPASGAHPERPSPVPAPSTPSAGSRLPSGSGRAPSWSRSGACWG